MLFFFSAEAYVHQVNDTFKLKFNTKLNIANSAAKTDSSHCVSISDVLTISWAAQILVQEYFSFIWKLSIVVSLTSNYVQLHRFKKLI